MAINLSGISLTSDVTGGGGVSGGVTSKMKFIPVTTLPPADEAKKTAVYLLPSKNTTTKNKYDEYVVLETASGFIWELFGQDVSVDLQSFATKTDLNKKQDKLVNQQNIRSINGIPLVGAGNIQLETLTTAEKNKILGLVDTSIKEAPADGKQYARKNGEWSEVEAAGGDVSSESTDEVAASVEESIMAQYGTNITQLGLELSEIKEQLGEGGGSVDAYTKAESDERFADKIVDVTDAKVWHEELLDGKKIVEIQKDMGWEAMRCKSNNILSIAPKYIGANPGVTIESDNRGRVRVHGTLATKNAELCLQDETYNLPQWNKYKGKTAVICARGIVDSIRGSFSLVEGGWSTVKPSVWSKAGEYVISEPFVIPENFKYCRISCKVFGDIGTAVDATLWAGMFIVEDGVPIACDDEFEIEDETVCTLWYESVVNTFANTKEYIDKNAVGGLYVMPEKFGAKGDGVTDDSDAIENALKYAAEKSLPVKMYKNYLVSKPINIPYDGLDIEINNIVNSGTSSALRINGCKNTIKINSIVTQNASISNTAIEVRVDTRTITYNTLYVDYIYSKYGIVLNVDKPYLCYQNTFEFRQIRGLGINSGSVAITDVPEGVKGYTSENTFTGGHIGYCDIAYKGTFCNTKFYNIHLENDGLGFEVVGNPNGMIVGARYAEHIMSHNLVKFTGSTTDNTEHSNSGDSPGIRFISPSSIPIDRIDVSGNYEFMEYDSGDKFSISDRCVSVLDCPIACNYPTNDADYYSHLGKMAYIWGRKIICVPKTKARYAIEGNTLDLRNNSKLGILPTTFVVKGGNTTIYLHDSYIHLGISEFDVIQTSTSKAKIYNSDGKLIWNGWTKDAGTYKFEVSKSNEDGYDVVENSARYDGHGICWYVNGEFQTNGVLDEFVVE